MLPLLSSVQSFGGAPSSANECAARSSRAPRSGKVGSTKSQLSSSELIVRSTEIQFCCSELPECNGHMHGEGKPSSENLEK